MALPINTVTPIRTPSRYRELVEAIYHADKAEQETSSVEWKSEADLAEKRWQAALGRQVLGSANRDPEAAARMFGGCGYIVVGTSPGQVFGTEAHDAAKIEDWLSAYVGRPPNAPEWSPTYVEIEGKQVLILTVEAPKLEDPIWTCQREFRSAQDAGDGGSRRGKVVTRKGAIYVRRQASTVEAGPEEIAMLSRRLIAARRRVDGLSVTLLQGAAAQGVDLGEDKLDAWVETERRALVPPPAPPKAETDEELGARRRPVLEPERERGQDAVVGEPGEEIEGSDAAQPGDPTEFGRGPGTGLKLGDLLRGITEAQGAAAGAASFLYEPDGRTREEYQAEVDRYLAKGRKRLISVLTRRLCDGGLGRVQVAITNETDDPLEDVRLELYISAASAVALYDDDIPEAEMPARPVMLGKQRRERFGALSGMNYMPNIRMPSYDSPGLRSVGRRIDIDNSGSARITYDVGHLYPREKNQLDAFFLVVAYHVDPTPIASLTAEWEAVTRNLSGVQSGALEIPVAPGVPTVDELLSEQPGVDDEAHDDEDDDLYD